jgi:carbon storage regulator
MLVLTRKVGERISIGPDVVVVVLEVRGQHVRVGVEAPPSVPVWREEVLARQERKVSVAR